MQEDTCCKVEDDFQSFASEPRVSGAGLKCLDGFTIDPCAKEACQKVEDSLQGVRDVR